MKHHPVSRSRTRLALLVLLSSLVGLLLPAAPASAADGIISGTVVSPSGAPLPGIDVDLYRNYGTSSAPEWEWYISTDTDQAGRYRRAVGPGTYRLGFTDHYEGLFVSEYYANAPTLTSATSLAVSAGDPVVADATLAIRGTVTGAVTTESGAALPDTAVSAYQNVGTTNDPSWTWIASDFSDASGHYRLPLDPGGYRLHFGSEGPDEYSDEYYDDAASIDTATDVMVGAGTTTADAALALRGAIEGAVTSESGQPLRSVSVIAYQNRGTTTAPVWLSVDADYADDAGRYHLDVDAGVYRLLFTDDRAERVFIPEYYDDAATIDDAADVHVAPGATATADVSLTPRPVIAGAITSESGRPLPGISVVAYRNLGTTQDPDWEGETSTYTDAAGRYRLTTDPGTYRLRFLDQSDERVYVSEYYDDAVTVGTAVDLTLVPGGTTTADASLAEHGSVAGTVTAQDTGEALASVGVTLYGNSGTVQRPYWEMRDYVYTDAAGRFQMHADPGTYRLGFYDGSEDGAYASEYYADATTIATATDVTVTPGVASTTDASLARSGGIAGTVTADDSGRALPDVEVRVYENVGTAAHPEWDWDWDFASSTDASGRYHVYLGQGSYRLLFSDQSVADAYESEFYDDAASVEAATDVVVTTGATTTADAALATRGSISGTVTEQDSGVALRGVEVRPYVNRGNPGHPSWVWDGETAVRTNATGGFRLYSEPGTYRLRLVAPDDEHVSEYYDDATTVATAADLTVTSGVTTTADAALTAPAPVVQDFTPVASPVIGGTAAVGAPLTVTTGDWLPSPTSYSYAWYVDGVAVPGEVAATFVPRETDVGTSVAAVVTATRDGFVSLDAPADAVGPVRGTVSPVRAPRVTGTARVGKQLVVDPGTWTVADPTVTYQWLADGSPVAGATLPTFRVTAAQLGRRIAVRVVASRPWYDDATVTSGVSPTVTATPAVRLTWNGAGRRMRLTTLVSVPGLAAVTGKVTFFRGAHRLRTVALAPWGASVLVPRRKRPTTYTVRYAGASYVLGARASVTVRP